MRVIAGTAKGTKLNSIDDISTRPTLDRVKEPLFSIIQNNIVESNVLDLFVGSGALGIESLSRGAKHCTFCDKSYKSIQMLKENIQKVRMQEKSTILNIDYKKCLDEQKEKFDIIFIDPPYKMDIAIDSVKRIIELELLAKDGIIIIETDEYDRVRKMEVYGNDKFGE